MAINGMVSYLRHKFLLMETDRCNVTCLDSIQAQLALLQGPHVEVILQSASGKELSALMPSILDKAFKGEL